MTGTSYENATKERVELKKPSMWKVIMHNDDVTPMNYVVEVLITIFKHPEFKATDLMMQIHTIGYAIAGVYSHEIASQKIAEVLAANAEFGFQLKVSLERDE